MNYKPSEADFISYLYGEMTATEKKKMQAYLDAHPDEATELEKMNRLRSGMQQLSDQPVSIPINLMMKENQPVIQRSWWKTSGIRVAAIATLLMLTAYFTNLNIQWQDGQLLISFGRIQEAVGQENVKDLIREERKMFTQQLQYWTDYQNRQDSLNQVLGGQIGLLSGEIGKLNRTTYQISNRLDDQFTELNPTQIESLKTELMQSNYQLLSELLLDAGHFQREYTDQLLAEFSRFVEQQRLQDLQLMELALNNLLEQADEQQQNTELLLAQLITQMRQTD